MKTIFSSHNFWEPRCKFPAGLIILAVIFQFVLVAQIGSDWRRITRPDTPTYLEPAQDWASGRGYTTTRRAPGFPLLAAAVFRLTPDAEFAYEVLKWLLTGVGILTVGVVIGCGIAWRSPRVGWWAGALAAWNLTFLANAPMLLSDTLFAFFAALQLFCFIKFYRQRRLAWFVALLGVAGMAALIRPINGPWYLVGLTLLVLLPHWSWRRKLLTGVCGLLLFAAIVVPWQIFNACRGAGFCIDTNTGAMLHQNGAMILAEVNGTTYEAEKQQLLRQMTALFADTTRFPDEASREKWRFEQLKKLVVAHPFILLKHQFNPYILLPDAPTFLELCGVTRSDRGTLNVLRKQGLFAAVKFYFAGAEVALLLLLPLLAVTGILYVGCAGEVLTRLKKFRRHWFSLVVALGFIEYYLFLPGAISAPRYQLPALPLAALLAALFGLRVVRRFRGRHRADA